MTTKADHVFVNTVLEYFQTRATGEEIDEWMKMDI